METKKILWQIHEGNISGANLCFLEYIDILQQDGFSQLVILPYKGNISKNLELKNISYKVIKSYSWASNINTKSKINKSIKKLIRDWISRYQTLFLIQKFQPDFNATNSIANPTLAYSSKLLNKIHYWFIHEFGEEDHGFTIAGNSENGKRIINKLSDKIIFNSKAVLKSFVPYIDLNKAQIVDYVIDVPIQLYEKKDSNILKLIILGQIAPSKNHLEIFKAVHYCFKIGIILSLDVVGSSDNIKYLIELKEFVELNKLEDVIKFHPPTNKPSEVIQQHDILVMCSRQEAFGRVTVEALKNGVPVIAANTGGSVELIYDNENGYLYESGNYEDLANKILKFISNRTLFDRNKISNEAQNRFNKINTRKQLSFLFN